MGEIVPDPPEILDNKFYCVHTEEWQPDPPRNACKDLIAGIYDCCASGLVLNSFFSGGFSCVLAHHICGHDLNKCERVHTIKGPYDSNNECNADCP